MSHDSNILIYQTEEGNTKIDVRLDIWMETHINGVIARVRCNRLFIIFLLALNGIIAP